jgi:hypothetical protein
VHRFPQTPLRQVVAIQIFLVGVESSYMRFTSLIQVLADVPGNPGSLWLICIQSGDGGIIDG